MLTNVKTRGTWAEVQLGALLEQVLTADQYAKNVRPRRTRDERVEFADPAARAAASVHDVRVWLPIDSKFPQEDYLRLLEAADAADPEAVNAAAAKLLRAVRLCAGAGIGEKYVSPPVHDRLRHHVPPHRGPLRRGAAPARARRAPPGRYRVVVAGPTTLAALLSSLRMGFQTLAIEQRASEVWRVLGAVKTEFGKFGEVLDKVKRQLGTASHTINETGARTRAMERKLRDVEELPGEVSSRVLQLGDEGYVQLDLLEETEAPAEGSLGTGDPADEATVE